MTTCLDFPGSRWWKFDFHAHTPHSSCFGRGLSQEERDSLTPRDWLLAYINAGIDCVAVTDHNGGNWIDELKRELSILKQEREINCQNFHIFPGVELTVSGGIHVLAVFDVDATTASIASFVGATGYEGTHGSSETVTSKTLVEILSLQSRHNCIVIPADQRQLFFPLSDNYFYRSLAA